MSYSSLFNEKSVFGGMPIGMPGQTQPSQAAQATPKKSIMQSVAPSVKAAKPTALKNHIVDGTKAGAKAEVAQNRQAVAGAQVDMKREQGAMLGAVQDKQREVRALGDGMGINTDAVYDLDKQMAADGAFSVAMQCAPDMAGLRGAGSFVTALQDGSSSVTIGKGECKTKAEADALLQERAASAAAPTSPLSAMPGQQVQAVQPSAELQALAQNHELKDFMALNEGNLAEHSPEYRRVSGDIQLADNIIGDLNGVEQSSPAANAEDFAMRVELTSGSLQWMPGGMDVAIASAPNARDTVAAPALAVEFDPRQVSAPAVQNQFGMSA